MSGAVAGELAAGRLLVATPTLVDPSFANAVVLLLDHDAEGSLGVILNRPSAVTVASVLADWAGSVDPPEVLFEGGPVSTDAALALALVPDAGSDPIGFRCLFDRTGIIDLDTPPEVLAPAITRMRVFAGYSGWSGGQLQAEIDEGAWYVLDSLASDVFASEPAGLWSAVLRRQPGSLAWVSTRPADPTMN